MDRWIDVGWEGRKEGRGVKCLERAILAPLRKVVHAGYSS